MKNAKITIGLIGLLLIGLVSVRKEGKVQEAGLLFKMWRLWLQESRSPMEI